MINIKEIPADRPVLIAGPTASGKSALAIEISERQGGVIVNADASQVFDCWRAITARPSKEEETRVAHALYGHQPFDAQYSAGHWLRDVTPLLNAPIRPIIVGGTGLYFLTLTQGMADIPATPAEIRAEGDSLTLDQLRGQLDDATRARIDMLNRARVQRAWEVLRATGRPLADWQDDTPPAILPIETCTALVMENDKNWLEARIRTRFSKMLDDGALDEIQAMRERYDPALASCKAIGVPELMRYTDGNITLEEASEQVAIATRQYAKRQRTWFRKRMANWNKIAV